MSIWLAILAGLVLLVLGGESLVRGASALARRWGVSPLMIGLVLVGFGTSLPELVTSVRAAMIGASGIAYGNIVGSNIANILLIGGLAAMLQAIPVGRAALYRDLPVMMGVTAGFALLAATIGMGRGAGMAALALLVAYVALVWRQERHHPDSADDIQTQTLPTAALMTVAGLAMIIIGGRWLVDGAVALAEQLDVPQSVIGLTIVAVGTSLPELVTSVIAALRRQVDLAFGNIVGSNIYNILAIGGVTAIAAPGQVPDRIVWTDNMVMLAASALFAFAAITATRVSRGEGAALLTCYGGYLLWQIV
ncbi:calcium/sodium antiporter [Sagittula sp. SSi028]|uniref:calcium/sodium antiporter n=1 Tax=Sagittula sp. SSi028 TaxID=3400636 RepID=UPI003AF9CCF8